MDFEYAMAELMGTVEGAIGVLLLDWDGEAVDVLDRSGSVHDVKILGAYQGIFLNNVRDLCRNLELGECQEMTMQIGRELFLTYALPEGYYLTLILEPGSPIGAARAHLSRSAERIRSILF